MGEAGDMDLGLESLKGFSAKMVQAVLGFGGAVLFARILGPADFGGFYFLLSMVFISDRPVRGFAQAIEKRYSETGSNKSELAGGAILITVVAVLIVGVVVLLFRHLLVAQTNIQAAPAVFLALFAGFGAFLPVQKMLGGEGWISLQTWNDTLRSILTLPLQIGFVLAGFGAAGMGYGLAAATFLVVPVALYFLQIRPAIPSQDTLASLWEYARYSTIAALVGKAYDRFDILLLGVVLATNAVGHYEVAFKLTVPGTFLAGVVASGLTPKVSNRHSKGEAINDDISNAISYASILAIPTFFGALAMSRDIIVTTYGPEYAEGAAFLIGLAFYQVLFTQTVIYQHALSGLDRPDVRMKVNMATLAVNVVLGLALLEYVGALGVVIATILAEILRYMLSMAAVRRYAAGVDVFPRTFLEQVFSGVIMFVVVSAVHEVVGIGWWFELIVLVGLGASVYGLILLAVSPGLRFTLESVYRDATT